MHGAVGARDGTPLSESIQTPSCSSHRGHRWDEAAWHISLCDAVSKLLHRVVLKGEISYGGYYMLQLTRRLQGWQAASRALHSQSIQDWGALGGHQIHLQGVLGISVQEAGAVPFRTSVTEL